MDNIFLAVEVLKKTIHNFIVMHSELKYESESEKSITFSMRKHIDSKKREYGYLDYKDALELRKEIISNFVLITDITVTDVDDWVIFKVYFNEFKWYFIWKTHNQRFITSNSVISEKILDNFLDISLFFNKFANLLYNKEDIVDKLSRMKVSEEWLVTTPMDDNNSDGNYHTIIKKEK